MSNTAVTRARRSVAARRRGSQRGIVAVEFAFVLPLLVMLLLGIVTGGVSIAHGVGLSNAVREGARFGATGDASATPATWAADTITRVRESQFDDNGAAKVTAICVQLWKASASGGAAVASTTVCSQGNGSVTPALSETDAAFPTVPTGLTAGTCVVRVLAARKYNITLGLWPTLHGTTKRGSVARYERTC